MWLFDGFSSLLNSPHGGDDDQTANSPASAAESSRDSVSEDTPPLSKSAKARLEKKVKGFFDLAKVEIDKAIKAEESGISQDALEHYRKAQRILAEGLSTAEPNRCVSLQMSDMTCNFQKRSWSMLNSFDNHNILLYRGPGKTRNWCQKGSKSFIITNNSVRYADVFMNACPCVYF